MTATPTTMSEPIADDVTGGSIESPVDDETYNVLMALASKLEAIDTYRRYAGDGEGDLWRELAQDERRHAQRLFGELKARIAR
jgi:hypothetical protein